MFRLARIGCAIAVFAFVASACAQDNLDPRSSPATPRASTQAILNQVLPDITFEDTPLETVMNWLQGITHLNIVPHWQTLEDAGIKRDKPITIQAHNLRLTQVLWLIMSEAGGSDLKLAYRASGNLLVFSTADELNREMLTKVYDVADLLTRIPLASRQSGLNVTQGLGGQNGGTIGSGGSGSGIFQPTGTNVRAEAQNPGNQETMDQLLALIRDVVEPDTWRENGGGGSISAFQNTIIVRNTILVHQRLGGYVRDAE